LAPASYSVSLISVTDTSLQQFPSFTALVLAAAREFIRQNLTTALPLKF
jgi:hypothetical protein